MSILPSLLLHSRTQSHIFHFRTTSYSQHKALENYYNSIVPLLDSYTESYQGKYGIINHFDNYPFSNDPNDAPNYFYDLILKIKTIKIKDPYLRNIIEEINKLLYQTLYMLVNLH